MRSGAVILLLASAILIAFRLHAFDLPLETDECNYALVGARLLAGDRLYVNVWDHQPPGVFMLFGGVIALFGHAPIVFRCLAMAFSLASLLFVFAILRRIAGRSAALLGAMLFAIVSSDPGTGGEGCNREIFMNTLILAAWYFALRSRGWHGQSQPGHESVAGIDNPAPPLEKGGLSAKHPPLTKGGLGGGVIAGFAIAFATLLKTNVAVHWVFLAVWLAYDAARSVERTKMVRRIVTTLIAFSLGPILIWAGTFAYFAATDRLHEFLDAAFLFNLGYTDVREPFLMRFWRFFAPPRHPFIFESALPLWLLSIPAAAWLLFRFATHRDKNSSAVFLLLAASYVATCLPGRFWPHYYYLMIPAVVLAVATALGSLAACAPPRGEPPPNRQSTIVNRQLARPRLVPALAALQVLIVGSVLYLEYHHYLSQPPLSITIKRYNTRDFWGRAQGENVARVTKPGDTVFVYGNDASIYYYSKRKCASRYTMITGLGMGMPGALERRRILMSELRAQPPRLIIDLRDQEPFEGWNAFIDEVYGEPIGVDLHDRKHYPIMFVFARKDAPVESIDWDWDRSRIGGSTPGPVE
jgi:hypothetical protein